MHTLLDNSSKISYMEIIKWTIYIHLLDLYHVGTAAKNATLGLLQEAGPAPSGQTVMKTFWNFLCEGTCHILNRGRSSRPKTAKTAENKIWFDNLFRKMAKYLHFLMHEYTCLWKVTNVYFLTVVRHKTGYWGHLMANSNWHFYTNVYSGSNATISVSILHENTHVVY